MKKIVVRGDVDAMVRSEWVCGLIATKKFSDAVRSELGQLGEGLALRFNEAVEVDIRNNIAFGLSSFLEDTPWCTLSPSPNDPARLSICLSEDFEVVCCPLCLVCSGCKCYIEQLLEHMKRYFYLSS